MKRAVILHGTAANHTFNWFPWLAEELKKIGYEVWVPDLPDAERPNMAKYQAFLLSKNWDFTNNLVIGHSAGAVATLGLLGALPEDVTIDTAILVGAFTKRLSENPDWEVLQGLFTKPFDFPALKKKAKQFIFVHSDNDPICPIEQPRELCAQLSGEFVLLPGMGHFSAGLDPRFTKFPELLTIIKERVRL